MDILLRSLQAGWHVCHAWLTRNRDKMFGLVQASACEIDHVFESLKDLGVKNSDIIWVLSQVC